MNFLKKLFGKSDEVPETKPAGNPENSKLHYLLDIWVQHPSTENYRAVVQELMEGNSFLLLPTANTTNGTGDWETAGTGTTINLTSVFNMDGLKVLGAFSSETALVAWTKKETQYTGLRMTDIIEICKQLMISRVVINSDQKNMFVLERNQENITTRTIEKETKVLVGTPANPLNEKIISRLKENFRKVDTIQEAYQFAQSMENETSIVLGIRMSADSENAHIALRHAVNDALQGEELKMPLDVMVLPTDGWLETVRGIKNALFYTRNT
jgi:hypothetical protein